MFKHIVWGGGAYLGLHTIGALYELNKEKIVSLHRAAYTRQDGESDCSEISISI